MYAAPCDLTDNAVHYQPVRLLEVLHGLLRPRSKGPGDVLGSDGLHSGEAPLKSLYVIAGVTKSDGRRHVNSSQLLCSWPQKSGSMSFHHVRPSTTAPVARRPPRPALSSRWLPRPAPAAGSG